MACLLVTPLLYTENTLDPALLIKYLFSGICLFLANISLYAELRKSAIKKVPFNASITFSILFIIVGGCISLTTAVNTPEAIFDVLRWCFVLNVFFLFKTTISIHSNRLHLLEKGLILLTSIVVTAAAISLLNVVLKQGYSHQSSYEVSFTFAHRNLLSQVLLFLLILQFPAVFKLSKIWNWLTLFNTLVGLALIIGLLVRSVWLATVAAMFSVALLAVIRYGFKRLPSKKVRLALLSAIIVIGAAMIGYSQVGGKSVIRDQTHFVSNTDYGSSLERMRLWQRSLELIKAHPIVGVGGGNWRIRIAETRLLNMRSDDGYLFFQRPHNDLVWITTENGIVGGLLYVLIFILALAQCFRALRHSEQPWRVIAVFAAIVAYLVIAMLSFPKERATHQILLCLMLAWVPTKHEISLTKLKWVMIGLIPLSAFCAYVFFQKFSGEKDLKEALAFRERGHSERVVDRIDDINEYWTSIDNTGTPIKWYSGSAYYTLGILPMAKADFEHALKRNPNHPHVLNNLASTCVNSGQTQKAKWTYWKAHDLAPRFTDPLVNLAAVYFNEGKLDSGLVALAKVDTTIYHPSYQPFLTTIVDSSLAVMEAQESNEALKQIYRGMKNNSFWGKRVFYRAIDEGVSFDERAKEEAIFLLRSNE